MHSPCNSRPELKLEPGRRVSALSWFFLLFNSRLWLGLVGLLALTACATYSPGVRNGLPTGAPPVELSDTPFIAQEAYQCGPASLAMLLRDSGVEVSAQALVPRVYIPELKGSLQAEMIAATRDYGRMPYQIAPTLGGLLAELRLRRPVLVLQNLGWNFYPVWHYAVVIGYLPKNDQLILRSGTTRRELKRTGQFLDDWGKADNWGVLALLPGSLPADTSPERYLTAAAGMEAADKIEAAAQAYTSATVTWPNEPAAWLGRGNAEYAQGNLADAERYYRAALKHVENHAVVRNNLAQVLAEQGCVKAARRELELALEGAPRDLRPALLSTLQEINELPASNATGACPIR